jgi:hypothetical protein
LVEKFTKEVIIDKVDGAFEKFKVNISKLLNDLKEFETTEEDYLQFITNKPTDEEYEMAKTILGNIFDK